MRKIQIALASVAALGLIVLTAGAGEGDAAKILGQWKLVKGDIPQGASASVEFGKDGKMTMRATFNGKEFQKEGTYKVEGKKIQTKLPFGDKMKEETTIIEKLEGNAMQLKHDNGKVEEYERIVKK